MKFKTTTLPAIICLLFIFSSCQKEEFIEDSSYVIDAASKKAESSNVQAFVDCLPQIEFHNPQMKKEDKITGIFEGIEVPDEVQIKGTNDIKKVGGNGKWKSKKKYTSLDVTLVLLKDGNTVKECSYDNGGIIITPPSCAAEFVAPATVQDNGPGGVDIQWVLSAESGDVLYEVERQNDGGIFSIIATVNGTGSGAYSYIDSTPPAGSACYRVFAVCAGDRQVSPDPIQCKS